MALSYPIGTDVRITAWGAWNGTPPDLARLPTVTPGRVVGHRRDRAQGEPTYAVDFPGYGVLQCRWGELMPHLFPTALTPSLYGKESSCSSASPSSTSAPPAPPSTSPTSPG